MTHVTANRLISCIPAQRWFDSANTDNRRGAEIWRHVAKALIILIVLTLLLVSTSIRPHQRIDDMVSNMKVETRLARVTFYWSEEGDYYTSRRMSATGVRLQDGHCAVDPKVIPYGSVVKIPGMGEFVAVDTGSAVVSRRAAREAGRNPDEKNALVVDVYCSNSSKARVLVASAQEFAVISWSR